MKIPSHILQLLVVSVPIVAACGDGGDGELAPATTDQSVLAEPSADHVEPLDRASGAPGVATASSRAEPPQDDPGVPPADDEARGAPRDPPVAPSGTPGRAGADAGAPATPEPCPACGLG